MGCSTHVVPYWSKVAMRSSGATNCGLLFSVVFLTKSRIAFFAGPSFHEGSGSVAAVAVGCAPFELGDEEFVLQPTTTTVIKSVETNTTRAVMLLSPGLNAST